MRLPLLLAISVLACSGVAFATGKPFLLREVMSAADYQRAGLEKLSSQEVAALESWIEEHFANKAGSAAQRIPTPSTIESHIPGEFEGWDGDTIFPLENGQIWKQVEFDYEYHYAYRPAVTIVRANSGWVMRIEGMSKVIGVERVR